MKEQTARIHKKLLSLARVHRECMTQTLEHLGELNKRKGFLELGHPSLMKYCVKELGLSESAAYRRVKALKIVAKIPSIKEDIKKGAINLAQISKAEELFESYRHENGRKVPDFKKAELLEDVKNKDLHNSENDIRAKLDLPAKPKRVTIEVSEETHEAWLQFKASMAHKDMSDEMLLRFAIEKAGSVEELKRKRSPKEHNKDSRYIPAHIKRDVFKKAGYKCSWKGCDSVYALEIDHIKPFSQGGKTEPQNLRLLCRNHNQARNYG